MSKISFVYFDVGGVVVQDFSGNNKRQEMFQYIGVQKEREKEFDRYFDQIEIESTRGIDIDSFTQELITRFNLTISTDFSFRQYAADHLESNPSLWPVIGRAQSHCPIGLLTDMYPKLLDDIKEHGLLPPVEWDVIVDSSIEKFQKPDQELYKLAQTLTNVSPDEILFIDNLQHNLDPAIEMGWQTFLYDSRDYEKSSLKLAKFLSNLV